MGCMVPQLLLGALSDHRQPKHHVQQFLATSWSESSAGVQALPADGENGVRKEAVTWPEHQSLEL